LTVLDVRFLLELFFFMIPLAPYIRED